MKYRSKTLLLGLLIFLCLGVSCIEKKSEEKPPEKVKKSIVFSESQENVKRSEKAQPRKHECEPLMMSSNKPSAVWKMKNDQYLIVCNLSDYDKINDNKIKGWINVYERPVTYKKGFIKEVNSELPSSQITFLVEKQSDTTILITKYIEDLTSSFDQKNDIAATQFKIDCSGPKCSRTKETCVYKKPNKNVNSKIIDYVENISKGKETNLEKFGYYDVVIEKLINAALVGNKRAQKLVLETSRQELKVDGAAAESFSEGYRVLSNLVELGCLKE